MILVDTSAWIAFFRRNQPLRLEEVLDFDDVVTCLPVVQEVLQGFRDEATWRRAREAMLALPIIESPMEQALYIEAVGLYRDARRHGITVRSSVDCLIAACALRHDLEIIHRDRDYTGLAKVSPLKVRPV